MKLNAGSGWKKKDSYINLDLFEECKPDILADLDKPLPFKDESFDEILADNVLEHIDDVRKTMNEFHRVIKPGGMLYIIVPQFPTFGAIADPTHKHYFIPQSFGYFLKEGKSPGIKLWKPYQDRQHFETTKNVSDYGNETLFIHMKLERA